MLKTLALSLLAVSAAAAGTFRGLAPGGAQPPLFKREEEASLYIRALFQDCEDSNKDTLAASFLSGTKHSIVTNKAQRDVTRAELVK